MHGHFEGKADISGAQQQGILAQMGCLMDIVPINEVQDP